jgi:hypothetical protein
MCVLPLVRTREQYCFVYSTMYHVIIVSVRESSQTHTAMQQLYQVEQRSNQYAEAWSVFTKIKVVHKQHIHRNSMIYCHMLYIVGSLDYMYC